MKQTITTLGGHSALEICFGAKKQGLATAVVVQRGRDRTYSQYYKNLVDSLIYVDSFKELTDKNIVEKLQEIKSIFIPHRYCQVYCDLKKLENSFSVPIFGNKYLLKYEEREGNWTQYDLLRKVDIPIPLQFDDPKKIDRLVIVKVKEAKRQYERAFFFASTPSEYEKRSKKLIGNGAVKQTDVKQAIIEEYLVGPQVNFNFFYSPLTNTLDLLGTDMRRQTNIDGLLRIPLSIQKEIPSSILPSYIETGHVAVTVKESLLEKAFNLAERLLAASKKIHPQGIIGPFALQSTVLPGPPQERIVVYDISLRMPGSPGIAATPYSQYHFGRTVSFGERIAMEIQQAITDNKVSTITT